MRLKKFAVGFVACLLTLGWVGVSDAVLKGHGGAIGVANITSGTVDGAVIGGTTPAAITGTTITATTKFAAPAGTAAAVSMTFGGSAGSGLFSVSGNATSIAVAGNERFRVDSGGADVYAFVNTFHFGTAGNNSFVSDAADITGLQRGTNAQTFRVYNTFTDASNYERLELFWTANNAYVRTSQAGTGTSRTLNIRTDGSSPIVFDTNSVDRWSIAGASGSLATTTIGNDVAAIAATAGSITGSGTTSFYTLAGTWNTSGVVPGAVQVNITNTASGAGSRLLELQRGGALQFGVTSGAASTGTQIRTAQATVPTCGTNCGTPGNVCVGSDSSMICTMGTTPASGFVITFNGTWAAAPSCIAQAALTGMATGKKPLTVVTAATTITVVTDGTAPVAGDKYAILCMGVQ